jgi:hypothetical protein
MKLRIAELHACDGGKLNDEWLVLENVGDTPFSTRNCALRVARRGSRRRRELGTIDPGFVLAPGDTVRIITGNPAKKSHGEAPADSVTNYNLFLGAPYLEPGVVVSLALRSHELASAEFDPDAERGVANE